MQYENKTNKKEDKNRLVCKYENLQSNKCYQEEDYEANLHARQLPVLVRVEAAGSGFNFY